MEIRITDKEEKLYKLRSEIANERKINEIIDKAQKQTYLNGFDFAILMQYLRKLLFTVA